MWVERMDAHSAVVMGSLMDLQVAVLRADCWAASMVTAKDAHTVVRKVMMLALPMGLQTAGLWAGLRDTNLVERFVALTACCSADQTALWRACHLVARLDYLMV
jgi:hypothetical protein